jgi:hypothetical protein
MRAWRLVGVILAIGAFVLAAAWPPVRSLPLEGGRMVFFWLGVLCLLAAAWGWRGG